MPNKRARTDSATSSDRLVARRDNNILASVENKYHKPDLSPTRKRAGLVCTPGNGANKTSIVKHPETPGGNIPLPDLPRNIVLEVLDIPKVEFEEMSERDQENIACWIPEIDVRNSASKCPSTFGATPLVDDESGASGFDSDWDDEYDLVPIQTATNNVREIPDSERLEEPVKTIVETVERVMDDEAGRLLGTLVDFEWREDFESFKSGPERFSGPTPGPVRDYDSAYDAFVDIWDKDIIDRIVLETNRYAQQTIDKLNTKRPLAKSSRVIRWEPTNADEILVLFAIFQFMGIDPRTSVNEYWMTGVLGMPEFRTLMTYNRYILLNKFLHFVDNSGLDQNLPQSGNTSSTKVLSRKLYKLAPIIEHLGYKFDSLYRIKRHVTIDDSLTLSKNSLSWIQSIRSKSAHFGIKSYELCESDTGYLARFQIYTGKTSGVLNDMQITADLGCKSMKTVLELLQGLEHRGHCVTMDNFYNSPSLARYLKSKGFDCFGTLRASRRYVPNEIATMPANVPKGTIISRHCGDLSIVSWKDSKVVNMISTYHNADTYVGKRVGKALVKPVVVRDYNKYMGGIDLKDQKLSMYLLERKRGIKWYLKMFKRLMNVSIFNSMIMYGCSRKRRGQLPLTHREFRYELAESLVAKHRCSRNLPSQVQQPVADLARLRRDIVHNPSYASGNNRRRCRVCYARTKTSKLSRFRCVPCDVFLCLGDCWKDWHTLEHL